MTLGSTCALNAASSFPLPPHSSCKERDTESGNDDFGARYYNSATGRFRSPDWSDGPAAVPYAKFGDPQSLNLYSYVYNNPLGGIDPEATTLLKDWILVSTLPSSETTDTTIR